MLRYFYLILLLICIKWCFCDDCISNQDLDYRNEHRKLARSSIGRQDKIKSDSRKYRQIANYDEEEEEPVAQIDVASFISNDDQEEMNSDTADDNSLYELQKETNSKYDKNFENNYEISNGFNYNVNSNLQNKDYRNNEESVPEVTRSKNILNTRFNREMNIGDLQNVPLKRSRKDDSSDLIESRENNNDLSLQPHKKCALKHMRIPFFSHDKSTKANKKGKKRRFFGGYNKNDKKVDLSNLNKKKDGVSSSADDIANTNKEKRSAQAELICPVCMSVFKSSDHYFPRVRRLANNVHNSRQFYAMSNLNINPKAVETGTREPEYIDSLENLEIRLARQSPSDEDVQSTNSKNYERGEQLRQLEEVERRINEIGERSKNLEKPKQSY